MAQEIIMPDVGSGVDEGILLNWTKKVGDTVNAGDVIAEIETDKATVEVPVSAAGTILQLNGTPGQALRVGSVIGLIGAAGEQAVPAGPSGNGAAKPAATPSAPAVAAPAADSEIEDGSLPDGVKASPVARKMAAERGIDLTQIHGTGPGGRIVKSDVENWTPAPVTPAAAPSAPALVISAAGFGKLPEGPDVEIIETSKMRSRIAQRMIEAKQQTPHFYLTVEVDVEPLLKFRAQINAALDEAHKISVNDLVVKAVALALRDFPNLNTHYYGDKLARHKRIHIGIAVALPTGGLINVVAKDADRTALSVIAAQNKEMIARARDNKLKPDDIQGSTFTVSNLGPYDIDQFAAIINPPEAGIVAVGSAKKTPIVLADGTLGVGNRMKLSVSVDHRVSDGAEGAQFIKRIKELLETPAGLV
ncbi:MAG: 2-oxo acid dehydrogenase subunit E2 [Anaerolineae bacterium]|nr:2-oxo acid dehydrogenase subunit E2 [Anaerolineae bacterium]NUQ04803.1 2-oxo acid dehydrogenase subunit E2 [Anaerolineae bacterium]